MPKDIAMTKSIHIIKITPEQRIQVEESLVEEYPLRIYLNEKKLTSLLCSPRDLKPLVIGYLMTEGYISDFEEILSLAFMEAQNAMMVCLKSDRENPKDYSSFCQENTTYLDELNCQPLRSELTLSAYKVFDFMEDILSHSQVFKQTGGVHTVGLANTKGVLMVKEDVARHNALSKVIGEACAEGMDFSDKIIVLSGRVSLEMLVKAARVGVSIVISKSAPTSLSVELAERLNITLVGFVRENRMNIYTHPKRILQGERS